MDISPSPVKFPARIVGLGAEQGITLTARRNVAIQAITASGDFRILTNSCPSVLPAKSTCAFLAQFVPTATGTRTGTLTVIAADQEDSEQFLVNASLTGTGLPVQLTSITVSPSNPSIALGRTQQFIATGNYNNGTTQNLTATWTSTNTAVATVSGGLAVSLSQGTTTITAASSNITGSTTLTVTPPVITGLRTLPDAATIKPGATLQMQAIGTYSDNSTRDLTQLATWRSTLPTIATVGATGLVTGVSDGRTGIEASYSMQNWQSVITVQTPRPTNITLSPNLFFAGYFVSKQFTATASFDDGSTQDTTSLMTWSSSAPSVASVTSTGVTTCLSIGNTTITAVRFALTATARLECPFFETYNQMSSARTGHTATTLNNGNVLITGGQTNTVDLYSPSTRRFTPGNPMNVARTQHTATALPDGRVLIIGGTADASAEIYDPSAGTFSIIGPVNFSHSGHTATLLPNGKVLIAGGSPELFDPTTNTFTPLPAMTTFRTHHTATLLPEGRVFLAGGDQLISTELFNPATNTFAPGPNMSSLRNGHAACSLSGGKVFLTGGGLNTTDIYDAASNTLSAGTPMIFARVNHTATLLSNGKVLVAGGYDLSTPNTGAELYDPSTYTFVLGDMTAGHVSGVRAGHSATTLTDGQVLIAGGYNLASAETYTPQ